MAAEWQDGIFRKIEDATYNTKRFWIEVPGASEFAFKAGQFVTLDLPIHENKHKRWRSYSIASAPDGTNLFELLIVLLDGGMGTSFLFNQIKENDPVQVKGPLGNFAIPELDRDLFMICTGTGIAPFRSMLYTIQQHNIPHGNIYLVFGTRKQQDLLYKEEMEQLEKDIPGFRFIPTLSREDWNGQTGYVHEVYLDLCKDKQPAHFMLCGWKLMINEARQRLAEMGYEKKYIHFELYG